MGHGRLRHGSVDGEDEAVARAREAWVAEQLASGQLPVDACSVAELAMRMPRGTGRVAVAPGRVSRTLTLDHRVMRHAEHEHVDPQAASLVDRARGGGHALDDELRRTLEGALGTHLDDVRIHTGADADRAAHAVGARAFALGNELFFRQGAYDPIGADGRRLIAHEVAHAVQARGASAPAGGELAVSSPGEGLEREADDFADRFMRETLWRPPHRREPAGPDAVARPAHPPVPVTGRISNAVLLRTPGDVLRANEGDLTLFLSQYEGDPRVPPAATRTFLTEPLLLGMGRALRDAVLANRARRRPPLTVEALVALARVITSHRGTALLLCHNVTKGFARNGSALGIARVSNADFYTLFSPTDLGTSDPGDWYHYFVISLPAFYTAAGALDTDAAVHPDDGTGTGMALQRGFTLSTLEMVATGMRDPAIRSTPAYEGWLNANALSFVEGGFYGVDQAEVDGESRVHVTGAATGVTQAGGAVDPTWKWYVPIVRGIGDARAPNLDSILSNVGRIGRGDIAAFSRRILDQYGDTVRELNTTVVPAPPAPGPSPAPAPPPPPPPPPNAGGGGILRRQRDGGAAEAPAGAVLEQLVAAAVAGGGTALPAEVRLDMEARLGHPLDGVRIHTDGAAAASASRLGARAFTVGRDIVFGDAQYAPDAPGGRSLLAHELAHTLQQGHGGGGELTLGDPGDAMETAADHVAARALDDGAAAVAPAGGDARSIRRAPGGTDQLHEDLVERWRAAHGLPPHGLDPVTQEPVGPTDEEIRFDGLLEQWLRTPNQARTIPAPPNPPPPVAAGNVNAVTPCQGAPDVGACRAHTNFVQNIFPQAVANIANVASPYAASIGALYRAGLSAVQQSPQIVPSARRAASYPARQVQVTVGGAPQTITLIMALAQRPNGPNGFAPVGDTAAIIELNEQSADVFSLNLAGIEETMVHEAMHILSQLAESANAQAGPGTARVDPSLDRASYPAAQRALTTAITPFIQQILALPSIEPSHRQRGAAHFAEVTVRILMSEALARVEAGIYVRQRNGQAFGPADVRRLPNFLQAASYWVPNPIDPQELQTFLTGEAGALEAQVRPHVFALQDAYLDRRP